MIIFSFFFLSFRYPHRWHRDDNNNNNNDDDGNLFGKSSLHASIIISFIDIPFASSQHQHHEYNRNSNDDDDDVHTKLFLCPSIINTSIFLLRFRHDRHHDNKKNKPRSR